MNNKKIAIVYDWMDKWGGVERVLLTLHEMYPDAPFYTSYYDNRKAVWANGIEIRESFIKNIPGFIKSNRILSVPLYPYAFESFNFNRFETVISVTSSFAKSIITQPSTRHLCYLLTPTRFLWSHSKDYEKSIPAYPFSSVYSGFLKRWDKVASRRPDRIISISETVRRRCENYYGLDSTVVYPPFDAGYWGKIKSSILADERQIGNDRRDRFFLLVSRLEAYKKVEIAVRVFNNLKADLVIVGDGKEEERLRQMAGNNIKFRSKLTDADLAGLYSRAEALIMPQEEDFGYVAAEALFFGCPVIAFKSGGAAEIVTDGYDGILFRRQTALSLTEAIERFEAIKYNLKDGSKRAAIKITERFDKNNFVKSFNAAVAG